ncbi:MAG: hydrogenase maturation protease, partial [Candidatus Omnitrophica bacterium]|nr:hydrogenase maturation protease [Candidatus Omnitrophota bacterium]
ARRVPLKIFIGGTAPENLTGVIKKFKPSDILIVDALEMNRKPGEAILIDPAGQGFGVTFSTHTMPAKILADYFLKSFKCRITMIGIQPKSIEFGFRPASKSVVSSARNIARTILKAAKGLTN